MREKQPKREWTEAEREYIRKNYMRLGDKDIALRLTALTGVPVTWNMVRDCRVAMGLAKPKGWAPGGRRPPHWNRPAHWGPDDAE
jgi:hypothetical protein